MALDYEEQRRINMENNRKLLVAMGLDKPTLVPKSKAKKVKPDQSKKRGPPPPEPADAEASEVQQYTQSNDTRLLAKGLRAIWARMRRPQHEHDIPGNGRA